MKAPPRLELTHATNDYIFSLGSLEGQTSPSCSGRRGPPPPPYSKKLIEYCPGIAFTGWQYGRDGLLLRPFFCSLKEGMVLNFLKMGIEDRIIILEAKERLLCSGVSEGVPFEKRGGGYRQVVCGDQRLGKDPTGFVTT